MEGLGLRRENALIANARWVVDVFTERRDPLKPACFVQARSGKLLEAGFKHETTVAETSSLSFEVLKHGASQALAAVIALDIHAPNLGG